jgi:hypothetical protein
MHGLHQPLKLAELPMNDEDDYVDDYEDGTEFV